MDDLKLAKNNLVSKGNTSSPIPSMSPVESCWSLMHEYQCPAMRVFQFLFATFWTSIFIIVVLKKINRNQMVVKHEMHRQKKQHPKNLTSSVKQTTLTFKKKMCFWAKLKFSFQCCFPFLDLFKLYKNVKKAFNPYEGHKFPTR